MAIEITDLLGVPFVLHGRTLKGFDCYGLVIEVEKRFGHKMVDLYHEYSLNNEKDLDTNIYNIVHGSGLIKSESPSESDVIMFYDNKGRVCHIGVYLEDGYFIHCDAEGVHLTKLDTYFRKWSCYTWL